MNAPDRFELFVLSEGVPKVTLEIDGKIPNVATLKIEKEDHTMGNLLRAQLLQDDRVLFAGYKVPHPMEHNFLLRVQTEDGYEPKEAVIAAAQNVISQLSTLKSRFEQEWELHAVTGM